MSRRGKGNNRSGVPRRSFKRLPRKTTILIVCEGKETERNYFDGLKRQDAVRQRFAVTVKRGKGGSPLAVAQFAVKQKNQSVADYDEVWCVMDVEGPDRRDELRKAIECLEANDIRPCLSNPAFEVWLLAHFEKTATTFANCHAVISRLNSHWEQHFGEKYDKADRNIYSRLAPRTNNAIENARWVLQTHHASRPCVLDCNSSTEVYILVSRLCGVRADPV